MWDSQRTSATDAGTSVAAEMAAGQERCADCSAGGQGSSISVAAVRSCTQSKEMQEVTYSSRFGADTLYAQARVLGFGF